MDELVKCEQLVAVGAQQCSDLQGASNERARVNIKLMSVAHAPLSAAAALPIIPATLLSALLAPMSAASDVAAFIHSHRPPHPYEPCGSAPSRLKPLAFSPLAALPTGSSSSYAYLTLPCSPGLQRR